jgi:hypothetical protein
VRPQLDGKVTLCKPLGCVNRKCHRASNLSRDPKPQADCQCSGQPLGNQLVAISSVLALILESSSNAKPPAKAVVTTSIRNTAPSLRLIRKFEKFMLHHSFMVLASVTCAVSPSPEDEEECLGGLDASAQSAQEPSNEVQCASVAQPLGANAIAPFGKLQIRADRLLAGGSVSSQTEVSGPPVSAAHRNPLYSRCNAG